MTAVSEMIQNSVQKFIELSCLVAHSLRVSAKDWKKELKSIAEKMMPMIAESARAIISRNRTVFPTLFFLKTKAPRRNTETVFRMALMHVEYTIEVVARLTASPSWSVHEPREPKTG